jgi:N-acetylmuramoyl-L-alanine amidase
MNTIVLFLLKSIAVSGILTTWYWLALRDKRLHNYNRFFLLFTLYASIQLPLLNIQLFTVDKAASPLLSSANVLLHAVTDDGGNTQQAIVQTATTHIDWEFVITAIAMTISAVLLAILLIRIVLIINLRRKYRRSIEEGVELIHTDLSKAPFSFMSSLFWRDDISPDSENGRLILLHELTHIRQKHTYDKLACQVLTCIFWMNPFYWLIQKELSMVHEFIADDAALVKGTEVQHTDSATEAFARMLLQTHNHGSYITPEHQFFSSPVKRRLTMLQTNKSASYSRLRRLGVLPLVAGSILLFSFSMRGQRKPVAEKADKKIVLVVDAGHGGMDLGTTSGFLEEKDLNLKVCKRISELAPEYNVEVHQVRDKDEYVSLADRVKISDKLHPDYFISIHVNNGHGKNADTGTFEIAINARNNKAAESRKLADAVYRNILRPGWEQGYAPAEKSLFVLRDNKAPAILIELGDIKNKTQMAQLNDNTKLDELCDAILKGVVEAHKN